MQIELAQRAAKWWADCLRNGAKMDNGAKDNVNLMTKGLALMVQKVEAAKRSTDNIDAFEKALTTSFATVDEGYLADVDYQPCRRLSDAAKVAGIDLGMTSLPWKTTMRYCNGNVQVKSGYGAAYTDLN